MSIKLGETPVGNIHVSVIDPVIVQECGGSEVHVMSQRATTKKLESLGRKVNETGITLVGEVHKLDKRVSNLEANLSDDSFIIDSSEVYSKVVPAGVAPYAEIVKIGGMSYRDEETNTLKHAKVMEIKSVSKNLAFIKGWTTQAPNAEFKISNTNYGTTISATTGNAITLTQSKQGNLNDITGYTNGYVNLVLDNKLTTDARYNVSFDITIKENPLSANYMYLMPNGQWQGGVRPTFTGNTKQRVNGTIRWTIRSDMPDTPYIEFRCCGMSFDIGNVMITREEDTDITYTPATVLDTFAIPEAVQNREGYGLGISNDVYNSIKYTERGVDETLKCKELVFNGSENWHYSPGENCVALSIDNTGADVFSDCISNKSMEIFVDKNAIYIYGHSSVDEWKAHLAKEPLVVVYPLAETVVTDITDLMPIDNFVKVQSGGVITPVNDYNYAVSTEIVYQKEAQVND